MRTLNFDLCRPRSEWRGIGDFWDLNYWMCSSIKIEDWIQVDWKRRYWEKSDENFYLMGERRERWKKWWRCRVHITCPFQKPTLHLSAFSVNPEQVLNEIINGRAISKRAEIGMLRKSTVETINLLTNNDCWLRNRSESGWRWDLG
jgi:hypothetical protein